ncbi:hypothetical protein ACJJTC_007033 [Scirpophaga incertulas]
MLSARVVVLSSLLALCVKASYLTFPKEFKFGATTDVYQIVDPNNAKDATLNVTAPEDALDVGNIDFAAALGLDFYRFTISWSRLIPNGFVTEISEEWSQYYSDLVDSALAKGVEPVVTLYHFDLPARLQNLGGWANPLISDWFASYARRVFTLYGDRVKTWVTINDPLVTCDGGYSGLAPPGLRDSDVGSYLCSKHMLIAHAKAWRIYDEEFRPKYQGTISMANHIIWYEPAKRSEKKIAELAMENSAGRYSHPIFSKEGGWPPALEKLIAENSKKEGFVRSRLPIFTKEEIELVRGTYDFYGMNHYTSRVVRTPRAEEEIGQWPLQGSSEIGVVLDTRPEWKPTNTWWVKQNPKGLRQAMVWLKEKYGDLNYVITGNGYSGTANNAEREEHTAFYREYLTQLLFAMKKDGVNVTAYTARSLMDNFIIVHENKHNETGEGLNATQPPARSERSSAQFYADVIKSRSLDVPDENAPYAAWISIAVVLTICVGLAFLIKYYRAVKRQKQTMEYHGVAMQDIDNLNHNK